MLKNRKKIKNPLKIKKKLKNPSKFRQKIQKSIENSYYQFLIGFAGIDDGNAERRSIANVLADAIKL